MYNCELNMEERKIIAKEGEEIICEANISVNDGIATVDFESIKCYSVSAVAKVFGATKTLLEEQGVVVDKVVFGSIAAVDKLDEHLSQMDKELSTSKQVSMR